LHDRFAPLILTEAALVPEEKEMRMSKSHKPTSKSRTSKPLKPARPLYEHVILTAIITVHEVYRDGFVEFKCESDDGNGEGATGHLTPDDGQKSLAWDMGSWTDNPWFWWDTVNGKADLTIMVNGVCVFDGYCASMGDGECRVISTCGNPRIYRTHGHIALYEPGNNSRITKIAEDWP
jgi:hypothetical protein